MPHILNIAFDFDDEHVKQTVEKKLERDLDDIIKNIILDILAPRSQWSGFRENERLINIIYQRMDALLYEYKDEIIEKTASKLADRVGRTKVFKEKIEDMTEGES